jgi:hypothetical protein
MTCTGLPSTDSGLAGPDQGRGRGQAQQTGHPRRRPWKPGAGMASNLRRHGSDPQVRRGSNRTPVGSLGSQGLSKGGLASSQPEGRGRGIRQRPHRPVELAPDQGGIAGGGRQSGQCLSRSDRDGNLCRRPPPDAGACACACACGKTGCQSWRVQGRAVRSHPVQAEAFGPMLIDPVGALSVR